LRLIKVIVLMGFLLAGSARSQPSEKTAKFKQAGPNKPATALQQEGFLTPEAGLEPVEASEVEHLGSNGARVFVDVVRFRQDVEAYELLSLVAAAARAKSPGLEISSAYGTAGFASEGQIAFFRGTHFFRIRNWKDRNPETLNAFVGDLSNGVDPGERDIPVLIKHLPSPEEGQKNAIYLHSFADVNKLGLQQGVLSAITSGGNADAALATYGPSKVLVVEFNTPQLAGENDQRIIARIQELWKLGQPAPTAYRRVGNYSVFVFDAPDEQSAKQLIDQVKYEQVVQWLGENPNILKEAERRYINTTLGVLVAVLKASGYALILCVGIGGLIGALLFSHRRGQQKSIAAFSDAGGMLRLNLDELTPKVSSNRRLRGLDR
jgi:hypothetical protein